MLHYPFSKSYCRPLAINGDFQPVMCWGRITLAHESLLFTPLPNSEFSDNHIGSLKSAIVRLFTEQSGQTLQIKSSGFMESQLLNICQQTTTSNSTQLYSLGSWQLNKFLVWLSRVCHCFLSVLKEFITFGESTREFQIVRCWGLPRQRTLSHIRKILPWNTCWFHKEWWTI